MQEALLPLFPLSVVLLPGGELPLHIFEDRYKEMIGLALEYKTEFGIVQVVKDGIARIGCTASVERLVHRYEDGRMDILTRGNRRFHVVSVDQDQAYLRARVTFLDDEIPTAPDDLRQEALEAWSAKPTDREQLSFHLAEQIDDLNFRQGLLNLRSEPERLRLLIRFAPTYAKHRKEMEHIQNVAPRNGHGKHS
jgi:Lon protease-like protein